MRHFFRCTVSGQGAPPNWGSIWIMRVRIMCPFPHDLLHSDHWDHSVSSQSMAGKTQMGMSVSHSEIRLDTYFSLNILTQASGKCKAGTVTPFLRRKKLRL